MSVDSPAHELSRTRQPRSPKGRIALCLLAAAVLLSGCDLLGPAKSLSGGASSPGSSPASGVPSKVTPLPLAGKVAPGSGVYLGVYTPPAPFDANALSSFEATAGKPVAIVMWYQPWEKKNRSEFDLGACAALMGRGVVPMITWEPWDPGTNANNVSDPAVAPQYRLKNITAGDYDTYIRTWARAIKQLGGPVMLRPMHEMNGNWYPWCGTVNGNAPADFVPAWRHIHDIFAEEGVTNVTWVWSVNRESVPATTANRYAAYYPGDAYVDWTSISGFNWGTSSKWSSWESWSQLYTAPFKYLQRLGKPICISEFASVEKGGSKSAWIADSYKRIAKHRRVRAVIYYNARESGRSAKQDWRIDTTPASARAFRGAIGSSVFSSGPAPALAEWQASLSAADLQQLETFKRLY